VVNLIFHDDVLNTSTALTGWAVACDQNTRKSNMNHGGKAQRQIEQERISTAGHDDCQSSTSRPLLGILSRGRTSIILFYFITLQWSLKQTSAFNAALPSLRYNSPSTAVRTKNVDVDTDVDHNVMIQRGQTELQRFFDFPLDDWQLEAGGAILEGHNVIVCAPTGAGYVVVCVLMSPATNA
jgi:hypothetical protein